PPIRRKVAGALSKWFRALTYSIENKDVRLVAFADVLGCRLAFHLVNARVCHIARGGVDMSTEECVNFSEVLTKHALARMNSRRISMPSVFAVLSFGREVYIRGAVVYAIGRNEVQLAEKAGIDLRRHEGLHVVCTKGGSILTVYRNRSLSDLRPRGRSR